MGEQSAIRGRVRRLNQRQRKKLRLGEFQELVFLVRVQFRRPMNEPTYEPFIDEFIDFIESLDLSVGGMGGRLPLAETEGVIQSWGRGSATAEDRHAVVGWLLAREEVAFVSAGELNSA